MARVYATTPGAVVRIDYHGEATETEPCRVPDEVGRELAGVEGLRVEFEVAPGTYTAEEFAAAVDEAAEPPARRKRETKPSALEAQPADQVKEG